MNKAHPFETSGPLVLEAFGPPVLSGHKQAQVTETSPRKGRPLALKGEELRSSQGGGLWPFGPLCVYNKVQA
uniref:Uncharacterized protein orf71 n=1 Tax=Monomastix sp. (strain OKE-1) TaxID=141716 RepID=C0JWM6_MONSK|nr:hypothetical protein MoOKC_p042 [Monomastix sp. OKE-1]ACK36934.1 unknown [Monomastix sp. OKE-1]